MVQNGRSTRVGARFAFQRGVIAAMVSVLMAGPSGITLADVSGGGGETLASIDRLARQGAPQLAERLLVRNQPSRRAAPGEWFVWERRRAALLKLQERPDILMARLNEILAQPVSAGIAQWALDELATAQLLADRHTEALATLRRLLWVGSPPGDPGALARWQRQIATAYLRMGRGQDADRAMARYVAAPTGSDDPEGDALLRARIALLIERPDAVPVILEGLAGDEAGLLRGLADLRGGRGRERDVLRLATEMAARTRLSDAERQQAWALMAESAASAGHLPGQMTALERLFDVEQPSPTLRGVFRPTLDQLWSAYLAYGREVANAWQLLVGDDRQWLRTADAAKSESPFASRGLYAVLIDAATDPDIRARAGLGLLDVLVSEDRGGRLALRLFAQRADVTDPEMFAPALRHRLIDLAVARNDVRRAAAWSVGLAEAPSADVAFDWRLRQARVLLLDGRPRQAIALLLGLVRDAEITRAESRDRFLQVVFDLQAAGQHAPAIELFETLMTSTKAAQERRELWYWIADSHKALDAPVSAARAYLASAAEPDPYAMDPWAQTARYQAAEQLTEAGLYRDARAIYTRLLGVTRDPARRAMLSGRIQQLRIKAKADGS